MNTLELKMLYKAETAQTPCTTCVSARIGRFGDVIVDPDLPPSVMKDIKELGCMEYPDEEYIAWLEQKVMDLLTNK